MIQFLAKVFRGLHWAIGITAPPSGKNERPFVFMWLGIIACGAGFCALLAYLMRHVF